MAISTSLDGVSPFKRGAYTFWPVGFTCLNLPPWLRLKMECTHVACIIPGPCLPSDLNPCLEIVADELSYGYHYGTVEDPQMRMMLIQMVGDYRGLVKALKCGQSPSHIGACPWCFQLGQPGPGCVSHRRATAAGRAAAGVAAAEAAEEEAEAAVGGRQQIPVGVAGVGTSNSKKASVYTGAYRYLPLSATAKRRAGAKLAPKYNTLGEAVHSRAEETAPLPKTDAFIRQAAMEGDVALARGLPHMHVEHPYVAKGTGIVGSHAFQILPYWDVHAMCHPDPAHTLSNESKAVFQLVSKVKAFTPGRLEVISEYESNVNDRWHGEQRPWLLTTEHRKAAEQRGLVFGGGPGFVPSALSSIRVQCLLSTPGYLKMHEHVLCLGPIAKYVLQGFLPLTQQQALFAYFDCLGGIWTRRERKLPDVDTSFVGSALAGMELAFPTWESDINRHAVFHLVEAVKYCGPSPTFTTFVFERMWGKLAKWLTQTVFPEATMINKYVAYKMSCQDGRRAAVGEGEADEDPTGRAVDAALLPGFLPGFLVDTGAVEVSTCALGHLTCFVIFNVIPPATVEVINSIAPQLYDSGGSTALSDAQVVELHKLFLNEAHGAILPEAEGTLYRHLWRQYW